MKKVVLFASGEGTNAEAIMRYFHGRAEVAVVAVFSNNSAAGVIGKAREAGLRTIVFGREEFNSGVTGAILGTIQPDLIVLAGFLWLLPGEMVKQFRGKIINIHPSLLPLYGGKGMYGLKVHEAVIAAGEKESGITIHFVNEHFDAGEIIMQKRCAVDAADTPASLAEKIRKLEHRYYPQVIEKLLSR